MFWALAVKEKNNRAIKIYRIIKKVLMVNVKVKTL